MLVLQRLRRSSPFAALIALSLGVACQPETAEEPTGEARQACTAPTPAAPTLDIYRSLAITDLPTLDAVDPYGKPRFPLVRVLNQIIAQSGATPGFCAADLYQRIYDTNNDKASGLVPDGQHCDDQKDASGRPTMGGFPIECPRQEGALADLKRHNPFCTGAGCDPYSPIAITNRFDLAPANGQTCGQYRIVYAKGVGQSPRMTAGNPDGFNRNLMIFEAILPNPTPAQGLAGCAPVVEFWASLSGMSKPEDRAAALDRFYFTGIPGFAPVIKRAHYDGSVDARTGVQLGGQVRTNGFMFDLQDPGRPSGQPWQLREFNLDEACQGGTYARTCVIKAKMVPTKVSPDASLFDERNRSPLALSFRDPTNPGGFLAQVKDLAQGDLNLLNMNNLSPAFNGPQATSSPNLSLTGAVDDSSNYNKAFDPKGSFAALITAALPPGSNLTAQHIVRRAQTQSCAGCHELATSTASFFGGMEGSNQLDGTGKLVWPDDAPSLPIPGVGQIPSFTQTSELFLEPLTSGVTCDATCTAKGRACQCKWMLSEALTRVFLPFRQQNMATFLARWYQSPYTWSYADSGPKAACMMHGSPDN
jgi:hypothetical protein